MSYLNWPVFTIYITYATFCTFACTLLAPYDDNIYTVRDSSAGALVDRSDYTSLQNRHYRLQHTALNAAAAAAAAKTFSHTVQTTVKKCSPINLRLYQVNRNYYS